MSLSLYLEDRPGRRDEGGKNNKQAHVQRARGAGGLLKAKERSARTILRTGRNVPSVVMHAVVNCSGTRSVLT
jgi:hypothetical protein